MGDTGHHSLFQGPGESLAASEGLGPEHPLQKQGLRDFCLSTAAPFLTEGAAAGRGAGGNVGPGPGRSGLPAAGRAHGQSKVSFAGNKPKSKPAALGTRCKPLKPRGCRRSPGLEEPPPPPPRATVLPKPGVTAAGGPALTGLAAGTSEARWAAAAEAPGTIEAGGSILTRVGETLVHIWNRAPGGDSSSGQGQPQWQRLLANSSEARGESCSLRHSTGILGLALTDMAPLPSKAGQAGAGVGRVPRDAVLDTLPPVQAGPQCQADRGCGDRRCPPVSPHPGRAHPPPSSHTSAGVSLHPPSSPGRSESPQGLPASWQGRVCSSQAPLGQGGNFIPPVQGGEAAWGQPCQPGVHGRALACHPEQRERGTGVPMYSKPIGNARHTRIVGGKAQPGGERG